MAAPASLLSTADNGGMLYTGKRNNPPPHKVHGSAYLPAAACAHRPGCHNLKCAMTQSISEKPLKPSLKSAGHLWLAAVQHMLSPDCMQADKPLAKGWVQTRPGPSILLSYRAEKRLHILALTACPQQSISKACWVIGDMGGSCRCLPWGRPGKGKANGGACGKGAAALRQSPGYDRAIPPSQAQEVRTRPLFHVQTAVLPGSEQCPFGRSLLWGGPSISLCAILD